MSKLRRTFEKKFNEKAQAPRVFSGILGDGFGNVDAGDGKVYVRIAGSINQALCSAVPYVNNLPVWVGYTAEFPNVLRVFGQQSTSGTEYIDGVGKHAEQHEWMGQGVLGGTDVLKVHLQQFMPLMVMPYSGLTVMIYPGVSWIGNAYALIADTNSHGKPIPQTLDLSTYTQAVGYEQYLLIGIKNDGSIEVVEGTEVLQETLTLSDIPEASATMIIKLAAVRRYNEQTEIAVNRETPDIVDLRFPMWRALDYDEIVGSLDWSDINFTGSSVGDLEDVDLTSIVDNNILVYNNLSGTWYPEAQNSLDVQELDGIPNVSGVSKLIFPNDSLTDNLDGSVSVLYPSPYSLTVQEIDGTPSVSGVDTINITSGTLTDNGTGSITINFSSSEILMDDASPRNMLYDDDGDLLYE